MELHTGYRKQNATFSEIIGEEEIIGTDCYYVDHPDDLVYR